MSIVKDKIDIENHFLENVIVEAFIVEEISVVVSIGLRSWSENVWADARGYVLCGHSVLRLFQLNIVEELTVESKSVEVLLWHIFDLEILFNPHVEHDIICLFCRQV